MLDKFNLDPDTVGRNEGDIPYRIFGREGPFLPKFLHFKNITVWSVIYVYMED